jgi:hypothetical protein
MYETRANGGSTWTHEVISSTGNAGASAIDVDAGGTAWVLYEDNAMGSEGVYMVSKPPGGSWGTPEFIDTPDYGGKMNLEFDALGNLHAVYAADDQQVLRHAWKTVCP